MFTPDLSPFLDTLVLPKNSPTSVKNPMSLPIKPQTILLAFANHRYRGTWVTFSIWNSYMHTDKFVSEIRDNRSSVLEFFGIYTDDPAFELPYIYWMPKMHRNPYKHRFNAGYILAALHSLFPHCLQIKHGLQHTDTTYFQSGDK